MEELIIIKYNKLFVFIVREDVKLDWNNKLVYKYMYNIFDFEKKKFIKLCVIKKRINKKYWKESFVW